ncbi:helix-turn-helix transcriptional regulator [Salinisphaera sp. T5B8]|uniref:helix-turn-helix transcriptional regulator n=1 Tax=Salinisphaera sp. T5B8 TaxID=1304154 RepID=UPI00333E7F5F
MMHMLVLNRLDDQVFTELEQSRVISFMPHLVSLKIRALIAENAPPRGSAKQFAMVICEAGGDIYYLQEEARHLLKLTFPGWNSTLFPLPLPGEDRPINLTHGKLQISGHRNAGTYLLYLHYEDALSKLSERERSIVELAQVGTATKLIARELELSPSTVSNHLQRVYAKLGIQSRAELVTIAQAAQLDTRC